MIEDTECKRIMLAPDDPNAEGFLIAKGIESGVD